MGEPNQAAHTWSWLATEVNDLPDGQQSVSAAWERVEASFLESGGGVITLLDWNPDFWVARQTHHLGWAIAPIWGLTGGLDSWPTFGADELVVRAEAQARTGHQTRIRRLMAEASTRRSADDPAEEMLRLTASAKQHGDAAMCQAEQVKAWLSTALGNLSAVPFTPTAHWPANGSTVVLNRLQAVLELASSTGRINPEGDVDLDVLYNATLNDDGSWMVPRTRIGQSPPWRHMWSWLDHPLARDDMLNAVRLAARLLRCSTLLDALRAALEHHELSLDRMIVCIIRRWLLTLQVLTWVEDALQRDWKWVRPQDLATFGFSAVKPVWPRPLVAISHRSADAKPRLQQLDLWRSPAVAIDASYVPCWETNTGMVWALFAATPLIVRVRSSLYEESLWCRREWELSEYLVEQADFVDGRRVVDVSLAELDGIDDVARRALERNPGVSPEETLLVPGMSPKFPPRSEVLVAHPLPEHEVLVLRAAGAIRVLHAALTEASDVNGILDMLVRGELPDEPSITNNVDGWAPFAAMFDDLATAIGHDPSQGSPLRLAAPTEHDEWVRDRALVTAIPTLIENNRDVRDLCAAIEWYRSCLWWFTEEDLGDHVVVDIRETTREAWATDVRYSHMRGILDLVATSPVWVLQAAGQNADDWRGLGECPLFTEHVVSQYDWMLQVSLLSSWPVLYEGLAGLEMTDALMRSFFASVSRSDMPEGDSIGPRDVFGMRVDDFPELGDSRPR